MEEQTDRIEVIDRMIKGLESNIAVLLEERRKLTGTDVVEQDTDKWRNVSYRIQEEGFEYCFKHYSDFPEIVDGEFHQLREKVVLNMQEMRDFVRIRIAETNMGL